MLYYNYLGGSETKFGDQKQAYALTFYSSTGAWMVNVAVHNLEEKGRGQSGAITQILESIRPNIPEDHQYVF